MPAEVKGPLPPIDTLPFADGTRERLLEAAGEVFAQKGFREATIREICARAGANIAAINYHFGGKERLYAEVLRYVDSMKADRHPFTAPETSVSAESRLAWFIKQFLRFRPRARARHGASRRIFSGIATLSSALNSGSRWWNW